MQFISHSQAGQDLFVYEQLVKPTNFVNGTFLDIGCSFPIQNNNTASLEQLGWKGLLIDISAGCIDACRRERKNQAYRADATMVSSATWLDVCSRQNLGPSIDYLSLDVDDQPGEPSKVVVVLKNLLDAGFTFRAMTIEHDRWRVGDVARDSMRKLLLPSYTLFAADVAHGGCEFEDWWLAKNH
jgi:hypothetical protein